MSVESINTHVVAPSVSQPVTSTPDVKHKEDVKREAPTTEVSALKDSIEPNTDELNTAVDKLNNFVTNVAQRDLSFSVDKDTNTTVVVVKDKLTQEVIRQMPTKEALAVAKQIESMLGLILNDKA